MQLIFIRRNDLKPDILLDFFIISNNLFIGFLFFFVCVNNDN